MRTGLGILFEPGSREFFTFTGRFECFAQSEGGAPTALLEEVYWDGKRITNHVWIHRSKAMKKLELKRGDTVQFQARVSRYARPPITSYPPEYDYSLESIREMCVQTRKE